MFKVRNSRRRHAKLLRVFATGFISAVLATTTFAETFRYPVLGRLTEKNGKPVDGPVKLQISFYRTNSGGASLLTLYADNTILQEGIFQISLDLTPSDYHSVFSSVFDLVYVEVTDMTHDPNNPYPRMQVGMTAFAGKVPVDGKTTYFDSNGKLAVGPNSSPAAGEFLTKDSSGNFVWSTPSANATTIGGASVSSSTPTAGQIMKYTAGAWTPSADTGINKSGDTGVGSLTLGAQKTLGLGTVDNSTETTLIGTLTVGGDKGKTWFNSDTNQMKYWNGAAAVVVGASGSGLTNLNGQTGNTQTFAIDTATGTAPAWSSGTDVHTLRIPLASAAGVTAGLLSKTDYDSFVAKLDKAGGTMSGSINLGGNDLRNIGNVILGTGDGTATPVAGTLMGPNGTGTDITGTDLTFDGGKGTGSGGSGGFAFRVAAGGGASGTTANTLATAMKLTNAGNLGVGVTSPTAALHLKAGSATAATAPFKFTSGTNLTTPEAGAVEYDGTNLYYTDGTATRRTIATTNGALTYSGAITMSAAGTGLAVTNNATIGGTLGVTGATTLSGGATVAANQNLAMASGTGTFTQTYTGTTTTANSIVADSVTTASAQDISADGLTSGNIMNLTSTSTAAAAGNAGLNIGISGANGTASITRYGMKSSVTSTGTTSTNVAGYFSASGATNNYGLIVENGNVGIGTTSPLTTLHVLDTTGAGIIVDRNTAPSSTSGGSFTLRNTVDPTGAGHSLGYMQFASASGVAASIKGYAGGAFSAGNIPGQIAFSVVPVGSGTLAEAMRISSAGYLGIGTTAPSEVLHVKRSVADETGGLRIENSQLGGYGNSIRFYSTQNFGGNAAVEAARIQVQGEANYVSGAATSSYMHFDTVSAGTLDERVRITAEGNVGIGTTTPGGKLEIAQSANDEGLIVANTGSSPSSTAVTISRANNSAAPATSNAMLYLNDHSSNFPLFITNQSAASILAVKGDGSVGIGTSSPTAVLHLKAGTATASTAPLKFTSGTNLTTPEAGAVEYDGTNLYYTDGTATRRTIATTNGALTYSGAITMSAAGTGLAVTNNATIGGTLGVTGATTLSGGATVAANQNLAMASGTGTFTQTFTGTTTTANSIVADSVTTASAQDISADGLTSGNIMNLTSTSTAAAAGNTGLNIGISGANGTASITRYGMKSSVTATGTTSTNVAGYFSASGATNNYGLIVENGKVGIGTTAPSSELHVKGTTTAITVEGDTYSYLSLTNSGGSTKAGALVQNSNGEMYFYSDTHAFTNAAGNVEKMRISSAGNVGIGTTAPGQKLQVGAIADSSANVIRIANSNGADAIPLLSLFKSSQIETVLAQNNTNFQFAVNPAGYTSANINSAAKLTITSIGDVGIGTSSPIGKLEVVDTTATNVWASFGDSDQSPNLFMSNQSLNAAYGYVGDDGTVIVNRTGYLNGVTKFRDFSVMDGKGNNVLSVDGSAASVGIGTTSPSRTLHVAGGTGIAATAAAAATAQIAIAGNGNTLGTTSFDLQQDASYAYVWNRANTPLVFGTNGAARMTVDAAGNVGIGTSSPGTIFDVKPATDAFTDGIKIQRSVNAGQYAVLSYATGAMYLAAVDTGNTVASNVGHQTIFVQSDGTTSRETMRINGSGNVGIGTTSPGSLLTINQAADTTDGTQATYGFALNNQGVAALTLGSDASYNYLQSWALKPLKINSQGNNTLINPTAGNVGIGTTSPSNTLHVVGSLCVKSAAGNCAGTTAGTIYATTTTISAADLAEHMPVTDKSLRAGDVVVVDQTGKSGTAIFSKSTKANQSTAVGVISTSPGVALGGETVNSRPVALAGRVPANVTLEGGIISVGDYLVASSTPGKAMKAAGPTSSGIIGIALSSYNGTSISQKEWNDGVAHEVGHQVMMLVQVGAGSQSGVAALKAENNDLRSELTSIKAYLCNGPGADKPEFCQNLHPSSH